ncbi:MAG TPA: zinc ribbon domain-containing protein [Xanthobacteraceae bacterium]|jgi:putative FmdB family regulatory protein|nr:zinc ribbon domain-containing protein [Xanthobacteraceae bacterium]
MPTYDYECEDCGAFTQVRPMAQCDQASECPLCGTMAPRAFLTAPYFSGMSAERRLAFATNERSAHAPQRFSADGGARHGTGCSCCAKPAKRKTNLSKTGAKSFPGSRPWMLSH